MFDRITLTKISHKQLSEKKGRAFHSVSVKPQMTVTRMWWNVPIPAFLFLPWD